MKAELAARLGSAGRVALISHVSPDGDTLGAALALALGLEQMGKKTVCFCRDEVPEVLRFLPGADRIARDAEALNGADLIVAVDCGSADRMGVEPPEGIPLVELDHHGTNTRFGLVNWVAVSASASEMVLALLDEMGVRLTREMADCLYTGLSTDTGNFLFSNCTPGTHRAAARLLELGCDFVGIGQSQFKERSLSATRLLSAALASLEMLHGGAWALMVLTRQDMDRAGQTDTTGIVDYANDITGVEAGILIREDVPGAWKISLRTKTLRADRIVAPLGGGGHDRAAGVTLQGTLDEVKARIFAALGAEAP